MLMRITGIFTVSSQNLKKLKVASTKIVFSPPAPFLQKRGSFDQQKRGSFDNLQEEYMLRTECLW